MTTRVQSPEIGNALRSALALDAAGPMGLEAGTEIVPVAVVADVRELLTNRYIPVQQGGVQVAVAGEYSYSALEWVANSLPKPKRIILDSVTISSDTAGVVVHHGFSSSGLAGTFSGLPRRKVGSLQSSAVAARVVNGTNVNDPTIFIQSFAAQFRVLANTPVEIVFREPIILDQENQFYVLGLGTVNAQLRSHWQWREERV